METTRRPRLAVVVANGITGDSRVQKEAIAAAREGWDVTLIGQSTSKSLEKTTMGPIEVVRVPVATHLHKRAAEKSARDKRIHRLRRKVTQFGFASESAMQQYRAARRAWVRQRTGQIGRLRAAADRSRAGAVLNLPMMSLKAWVRLRRTAYQTRVRMYRWEPSPNRPTGDWRKDWPRLLDLDLAFGPVIEELQPDLIHANDITTIGTAALSAARLRARGRNCSWVYDAHEYVRGVEWPQASQASAYRALEREFIKLADAVVTVSPEIAEMLQHDYKLSRAPLVVRNTPVSAVVGTDGERCSVRNACGLPLHVPLLVYAGCIAAARGLDTVVEAMPELPDVHVAIVTGQENPELKALLTRAQELSVQHRIHVVPYVDQHRVPDYLSSADAGLICFKRTLNCEISLPTKLAEYLHARLPVVVSDVKVASEFVGRHHVGEVFSAGDPRSFAEAVERALVHRERLAENITEPILKELSWEYQSAELLRLYRDVADVPALKPRPDISWIAVEGEAVDSSPSVLRHQWRPLGDTPIKLGLGCANYAGQLAGFAGAVCRMRPDVSADVVMESNGSSFVYPADVHLERASLNRTDVQLRRAERVLSRYTHLLTDAFKSVLGINGDHIEDDLPALRRAKIKIALLAHGSEVRHPVRHLEKYEFSHFRDAPDGMVETLTAIAERNRRVAEESGTPVFVTTPDLMEDLPMAVWAPLVVDVDAWGCAEPIMQRRKPVILHAPSRRWTKGTERLMPVLSSLHERGAIDLRLAEGVPWKETAAMVKEADIVIDQVAIGSYGAFACEAMAAGKPVIAYLSDAVRDVVGDCPIVNASPATLRKAIESLIDDPEQTMKIGAASADYVRTYHDGAYTARVLDGFLK